MVSGARPCWGPCGRLWEPYILDEWRKPGTGESIQICNQVDCAAAARDAGYQVYEPGDLSSGESHGA
jgi:hypothetical protein